MKRMNIKIIILAILSLALLSYKSISNFITGADNDTEALIAEIEEENIPKIDTLANGDYFVNDSIFIFNDSVFDWVIHMAEKDFLAQQLNETVEEWSQSDPIEIEWDVLMDITYKLRYFSELDMEIYSPVFSKALKALDKKTVIIEGFVIPFDEEEGFLSLSMNPFASCFFCGNASPASVISLYVKNKRKRYKVDDFKKFKGTLYLNQDDPNEFYYILRDAVEFKG